MEEKGPWWFRRWHNPSKGQWPIPVARTMPCDNAAIRLSYVRTKSRYILWLVFFYYKMDAVCDLWTHRLYKRKGYFGQPFEYRLLYMQVKRLLLKPVARHRTMSILNSRRYWCVDVGLASLRRQWALVCPKRSQCVHRCSSRFVCQFSFLFMQGPRLVLIVNGRWSEPCTGAQDVNVLRIGWQTRHSLRVIHPARDSST